MPHILAQVRLRRTSDLPEDIVVNTFHFDGLTDTATTNEIITRLSDFYRVPGAGAPAGGSIATQMPGTLMSTGHEIRLYNMDLPSPRVPYASVFFTMTGLTASIALPNEVALCLSFRANVPSGTAPARGRGRVYIGPLTIGTVQTNAAGDSRPQASTIAIIRGAGASLLASNALAVWVVYSETQDVMRPVVAGWVDNAWDIQRRRGAVAQNRNVFP